MKRVFAVVAIAVLLVLTAVSVAQVPGHYYLGNDGFVLFSSDMQQSTGMKIAQSGQSGEIWVTGPSPEGITHMSRLTSDQMIVHNQMGLNVEVPYRKPDGSPGLLVYTMGVLTEVR